MIHGPKKYCKHAINNRLFPRGHSRGGKKMPSEITIAFFALCHIS